MDNNRKIAYQVLFAVLVKKQYSNLALNNYINKEKPGSPAFVREMVYGVLENKKLLDFIISKLTKKRVKDIRRQDLIILYMGVYQICKMKSVPEYAAVNESVNLAKKYAKGREKFVNGVLRSYIREKENIELPNKETDSLKYLSVKYSYENWIIKLLSEFYSADLLEDLLRAGNEIPPLTIRTNITKITRSKLLEKLKILGFECENSVLSETGIKVKGDKILDTDLYKEGYFSVQDEASQLVCKYLNPKENDIVVDVCAAPGGKTLSAAEKMKNTGIIYSQDIYEDKTNIIQKETTRLGLINVKTMTWDATKLRKELIEKADKVIADVPCSGLGVIRRKPEIKYKKNYDEVKELPKKQLEILETSSKYLKKGGVVVYSTCTINPYENEKVTEKFIERNKNFKIEESIQLLPNINGTDGFYICTIRKEA